MKHATILREEACRLFAGPHAAKRMARETGWRLTACQDYLLRRRQLSLDAAIELAGRNDAAFAALLGRIQEVREAANSRGELRGNAGGAPSLPHGAEESVPCCCQPCRSLSAEPRA